MTLLRSARLSLYGFSLALSLLQVGLCVALAYVSIWPGTDNESRWGPDAVHANHHLRGYSTAGSSLALITAIWIIVLLSFNHSRNTTSLLVLSLSHFVSFAIFSVMWLVLSIMLLSETRFACPKAQKMRQSSPASREVLWCDLSIASGTFGMVLWVLCGVTATVVLFAARKSALGLRSPIGARDHESASDPGPLKGPLKPKTQVRTALYSIIIILGLTETAFAVMLACFSIYGDVKLKAFGAIAAVFASLSWIWASVLLSYNRRPATKRTLTRAATHFYTLLALAILLLATGVMLLSRIRTQRKPWERCVVDIDPDIGACWVFEVNVVFVFVIALFLIAASTYIYLCTKRGGGFLTKSNVAEFDGEGPESYHTMDKVKPTTTTLVA